MKRTLMGLLFGALLLTGCGSNQNAEDTRAAKAQAATQARAYADIKARAAKAVSDKVAADKAKAAAAAKAALSAKAAARAGAVARAKVVAVKKARAARAHATAVANAEAVARRKAAERRNEQRVIDAEGGCPMGFIFTTANGCVDTAPGYSEPSSGQSPRRQTSGESQLEYGCQQGYSPRSQCG